MDTNSVKGIIELGNVYFKCIIFESNNNNKEGKILSASMVKSAGIVNSSITNPTKASNAIRSCIGLVEKKSNITLKKISVIFEQPEFLCTKLSKKININGAKIQREDINFLLKEGKKQITLNDINHSIIHIFNHNYIVDGKKFDEEPIDVYADYVSHEMTFLTAPKNNIKNIKETFINCDIEIERYISCNFALAVNLLSFNDLNHGSILIDIGHEKTSVSLFKNLAMVNAFTLSIGTNHITKDISKVCSLDIEESKEIKNKIDFSFENNNEIFSSDGLLKNNFFKNSSYRKISKSLMLSIIKARLDEIFQIIKKNLITANINLLSSTKLFITGGGSNLINLESYCSSFFGFDVKKIYNSNKQEDIKDLNKNFASCLGAFKILRDGWETEAIAISPNLNVKKYGFFQRIFKNKP
jgi:cell division protein FtsA